MCIRDSLHHDAPEVIGPILERELADFQRRRDDGSLFDLKADKVEDIADAIAGNISEGKAAALAKAIPEAIKERKRKQQRPAG